MRLLVTGGGTGGHVYPALAVVEELIGQPVWNTTLADIAWVGRQGSIEQEIVTRRGLAFQAIAAGQVLGIRPWQILRSGWQLTQGYRQSLALLQSFRPDVVLGTGGYVSVPLTLAARARHIPAMVYLPDMRPGLAVRFLSRSVACVAVSFETVARDLPRHKVIVSGYPVRRALYETGPLEARQRLGLAADRPVLLVFGGSRGARSINLAVSGVLRELLELSQVVHIAGSADYDGLNAERERLPEDLRRDYHLFAYLHEGMADALAAATVVVARSGAATLAEFPAVGVPAILVPYPYAGQHQQLNAEYLANRGAGVIVADAGLASELLPTVRALLEDEPRLDAMSRAARSLARPEAAQTIATQLCLLARLGAGGG